MAHHPRRVVMVSSLTTAGAAETLEALENGAVDFIAKPGGSISVEFKEVAPRFIEVLRGAVRTRLGQPQKPPVHHSPAAHASSRPGGEAKKIVAIASSTGGPRALGQVIPFLPASLNAAVVVVQHMPATFTKLLADRLSGNGSFKIKEAEEGEELKAGQGYMAPGGMHLEITPQHTVHITKDPPIGGLRPCADVTFRTIARAYGRNIVGVVLTGMGRDGTEGCREFRKAGCRIIAESKETAMIYGMPRAVSEAGLVDHELPLQEIAQSIADEVARL
jgi:two-component system chemotaxis response regulator CheB